MSKVKKLAQQQAQSIINGGTGGIIYNTDNFMQRGALSTDRISELLSKQLTNSSENLSYIYNQNILSLQEQFTPLEKYLINILKSETFNNTDKEQINMTIYILRKKIKNDLEIEFLMKVIKNINAFKQYPDLFQQSKLKLSHINEFKHQLVPKGHQIFEYGQSGNLYYIVLRGSVYCLTPNPNYKTILTKDERSELKKYNNQMIKEKMQQKTQDEKQQKRNSKRKNTFKKSRANNSSHEDKNQSIIKDKSIPGPYDEKIDDIDELKYLYREYPHMFLAKIIQQGEGFGEIALMTRENRTATMVAREDTHVLTLSREGFEQILGHYNEHITKEKLNFLQKFDFLQYAMKSQLINLLYEIKQIDLQINEYLYQEGDPVNQIYLIKNGEITLQRPIQENIDNLEEDQNLLPIVKNFSYKTMTQFNYFGEKEVIDGLKERKDAALVTSSHATVYAITKEKLKWVLGERIFLRIVQLHEERKQWENQIIDGNFHLESINPSTRYGMFDTKVKEKIYENQNVKFKQEQQKDTENKKSFQRKNVIYLNKQDRLPDVESIFPQRTKIFQVFQENRQRTIKLYLQKADDQILDSSKFQKKIEKKLDTNITKENINEFSRSNVLLRKALKNLNYDDPSTQQSQFMKSKTQNLFSKQDQFRIKYLGVKGAKQFNELQQGQKMTQGRLDIIKNQLQNDLMFELKQQKETLSSKLKDKINFKKNVYSQSTIEPQQKKTTVAKFNTYLEKNIPNKKIELINKLKIQRFYTQSPIATSEVNSPIHSKYMVKGPQYFGDNSLKTQNSDSLFSTAYPSKTQKNNKFSKSQFSKTDSSFLTPQKNLNAFNFNNPELLATQPSNMYSSQQ